MLIKITADREFIESSELLPALGYAAIAIILNGKKQIGELVDENVACFITFV